MGTRLEYRRIDVRDTELLDSIIEEIASSEGRMDGLVAAAGIQQETAALEYSAKDANTMFEINVTGVFMTAKAVAKQMIRFGNGGSIVMIASMSGSIANRVRNQPPFSNPRILGFGPLQSRRGSRDQSHPHQSQDDPTSPSKCIISISRKKKRTKKLTRSFKSLGTDLPRLQRLEGRRHPTRPQPRV
jgi:hypothetical protein